jgi:thioredoxin reductase
MFQFLSRYTQWLHGRWPAGLVEKLPEVNADGTTAVPGVRVVGDLTGVPLLKFAADSGARAAQAVAEELGNARAGAEAEDGPADLAIVGGGVAGLAAALEAKRLGLRFVVFEAAQPFATIANFPKEKPIFTYPTDFKHAGDMALSAEVKEALFEELEAQRVAAGIEPKRARIERLERKDGLILLHHPDGLPFRARRVIVAIGRSGNHRKLGVPGEESGKVFNRLHDPKEHAGQRVLVVGGGDSALEAAAALAKAGADVTLSYRGKAFSRAKPENVEAVQAAGATVLLGSEVKAIEVEAVRLKTGEGREKMLPNDVVFALIGREAPLDFFRRSGIPIQGETSLVGWLGVAALLLLCVFVYSWKGGGPTESWINPSELTEGLRAQLSDRTTVLGTVAVSMQSRSFYYTFI